MSVFASASGLKEALRFFEELPDIAEQATVLALNQVAGRDGLALIRRDMRAEVDFPKGYLEQSDRLGVVRKARKGSLSAVIRGRDRATSLARFVAPGQRPETTRGQALRVTIKPGSPVTLKRAFLIKLRGGNMGLAVRLKPGETVRNSDRATKLGDSLYLLYGPSVDQVFRGVANDDADDIAQLVENQFYRQFARLTNG